MQMAFLVFREVMELNPLKKTQNIVLTGKEREGGLLLLPEKAEVLTRVESPVCLVHLDTTPARSSAH